MLNIHSDLTKELKTRSKIIFQQNKEATFARIALIRQLSTTKAPKETGNLYKSFQHQVSAGGSKIIVSVFYSAKYAYFQVFDNSGNPRYLRHLANFQKPGEKMGKLGNRPRGDIIARKEYKDTPAARYSRGYYVAKKQGLLGKAIYNNFLEDAIKESDSFFRNQLSRL